MTEAPLLFDLLTTHSRALVLEFPVCVVPGSNVAGVQYWRLIVRVPESKARYALHLETGGDEVLLFERRSLVDAMRLANRLNEFAGRGLGSGGVWRGVPVPVTRALSPMGETRQPGNNGLPEDGRVA